MIRTELVEDAEGAQTFLMYKDYQEPVRTLPPTGCWPSTGEKRKAA